MPETKEREQDVVERVLAGQTQAVRQLYGLISTKLKRVFSKRVADPADIDELIQDTFLHLLDALPLFRYRSSLSTFTMSIARHELSDYWRKRYAKRIIRTVPMVREVSISLFTSATVSQKINQALENAYRQMKPTQVKLLKLKYEEGKSVKEIAAILGVTAKAVEAHLYRARKAFQMAYVPVEEY